MRISGTVGCMGFLVMRGKCDLFRPEGSGGGMGGMGGMGGKGAMGAMGAPAPHTGYGGPLFS